MQTIHLILPWPPSVNCYWRTCIIRGRQRTLISERGREFRADVQAAIFPLRLPVIKTPVSVHCVLYPPDTRTRDIDNFDGKAIWDALIHAGLLQDDSLIVARRTTRGIVVSKGAALLSLYEMPNYDPMPWPKDESAYYDCRPPANRLDYFA